MRTPIRLPSDIITGDRGGGVPGCVGNRRFKDSQTGIEEFALRHHDDIVARRDLVSTEHLSYQSFSTIPHNGAAQLSGGGDPEASDIQARGQDEKRGVTPPDANALFVDRYPARRVGIPPVGESARSEGMPPILFAADRETLAALCAPALEHETPVACAHTHEKPVRLAAVPPVRLERSLATHVCSGTLTLVAMMEPCRPTPPALESFLEA